MGKRRSRDRHQEPQSFSGDEEDIKASQRNSSKSKKAKQKVARESSSSSDSSSVSKKSSHSSPSPGRKKSKPSRKPRESPEHHEKRSKQPMKPSEDVQEQRSKWDSPERSNSHRNSSRQRRHSRSRSRDRSERDRDRQRDRERNREREWDNHMQRSGRERDRSKERRQRSRSGDRKDRERDRDRQRRSPDKRPVRRSQSPREHFYRGGRDFGQGRQRNQRRDNRNRNEDEQYDWGKQGDAKASAADEEPVEKEKPNLGLSGALTEDTNKVNGVVVKYSEPPEARKPKRRWRLYPFKGETALPTLHIHRQSCFLVGRDRKVVDLAVDHPSCSKQHAALQYRLVPFEREDGSHGKRVRLYLIDLESANGTFLNNKKIDGRKYYELMEKDVIKFGFSSREYVLLHENSKEDQEDDDVHIKDEPQDAPAEEANP
ncbi:FHA domain-containing protein DDL [Drosophila ficusphila]|uniref:FHA domain-containing protein DDL n=1 Tax=Drosophila ficusphila TaxID=30025 RepID=UPI0007E78F0A|nr:FHA domain-containing protein DDL [Drosophila ficusphila]